MIFGKEHKNRLIFGLKRILESLLTPAGKPKMDRKILVFLLLSTSILIFGCVTKPPVKPTPTPTPIQTPTPLPTPIPKPKLLIPDEIGFGEILQDTPVKGELEIRNSGNAPLTIYSIKAPSFIKFTSTIPREIPTNRRILLPFELETNVPKTLSGYIYIYTNDRHSKNFIPISGRILSVGIKAEEWEKEIVEKVTSDSPRFVKVIDSGVKDEWEWWLIIPNYVANCTATIRNEGDYEAMGKIVALAKENEKIAQSGSGNFYLAPGEERTVSIILDVSFFGSYSYEMKFKDVTESIQKKVKMINITKYVDGKKVGILDSFPKESDKAKTWKRSDYYNPEPAVYRFLIVGAVIPTPAPTSTPSPTPTPTQLKPVDFEIYVDSNRISECGWTCREIPATIKNIGDYDAHNVKAKLELFCNGNRVKINGKDYLEEYLGTIPAQGSKTKSERLEVGFWDGLCIKSNGVQFVLTISSTEKNKQIRKFISSDQL